jgi:hypothetical protein
MHVFLLLLLPSKFNAKCCPSLCSSSLLDVAGGLYHVFDRPVVIEVKLVHCVFSVLNHSDLQVRGEGKRRLHPGT